MLLLRGDNRDRHSFPTRRSSDLRCPQDLSIGGRRQSYDNACRHFAQNNTEMESPERKRTIRKQSRLVNVIFSRFFSCPNLIKKRSEEHTSELQSRENLVCRLLLE